MANAPTMAAMYSIGGQAGSPTAMPICKAMKAPATPTSALVLSLNNAPIQCRAYRLNTMPAILEAVNAYCTLGEICGVMRQVFGEYRESVVV